MDNWLLIVVLIIFALFALRGGIKGFFKISISLLSAVLTVIIVIFASPYVQDAVVKYSVLDEFVEEKCLEIFMPRLTADMLNGLDLSGTPLEDLTALEIKEIGSFDWSVMGMTVEEVLDLAGEFTQEQQTKLLDESEFPQFVKNLLMVNNNNVVYEELGVTYFSEYVAKYMSNLVVELVTFLLTFMFAFVIVRALSAAVDIIGEFPVVGSLNHAAGAVVGLVQAVLFVWLLFLGITLICTTEIGKQCFTMIEESKILTFLYDNNYLLQNILKL
ncbi:MAG: CvpA family protein [Schaedlerella sp.]|nr:CvpA family protein [Schaedlerella sp.]